MSSVSFSNSVDCKLIAGVPPEVLYNVHRHALFSWNAIVLFKKALRSFLPSRLLRLRTRYCTFYAIADLTSLTDSMVPSLSWQVCILTPRWTWHRGVKYSNAKFSNNSVLCASRRGVKLIIFASLWLFLKEEKTSVKWWVNTSIMGQHKWSIIQYEGIH